LLFGKEGNGLPTHLTELCQRKVTIPMSADVDSLNVGVAAGVLLHGLLRPGHAVEPSLDRQNRDVADRNRLLD
jgi:tRNA G18 (ribose-2'-O)-methylase SpoU